MKAKICQESPACGDNAAGLENLRVIQRRCNYSAFNGYRRTPSDFSLIKCYKCGALFRTKAKYVTYLSDRKEGEA